MFFAILIIILSVWLSSSFYLRQSFSTDLFASPNAKSRVKSNISLIQQNKVYRLSSQEKKIITKELELYSIVSQIIFYTKINQTRRSLILFSKLKQRYPSSAESNYFQALRYHAVNDNAKALIEIQKTKEKNPELSMAWNLEGIIHSNAENDDLALIAFKKAIELNPYEHDFVYNLALSFYKLGDYKNAIRMTTRSIDLKPNFSKSYYLQALAYYKYKNLSQALISFAFAEDFGEESTDFYLDYLKLAQELKDIKEVIIITQKLSVKIKRNSIARRAISQVWQDIGDYKKALQELKPLATSQNANISDKKKYIYLLVKNKRSILRFVNNLNSKEREELKLYAQEIHEKTDRFDSLKAQDPLLRNSK